MILRAITLQSEGAKARKDELLHAVAGLSSGEIGLFGELAIAGYDEARGDLNSSDFGGADKLSSDLISNLKPGAFAALCLARGGYDEFVFFSSEGELYSQRKTRLFAPGGEESIFSAGEDAEIKIFEVADVKFGALICFELRFCELWTRLKGAQVVLVSAMWGKAKEEQFEVLARALALQNRCYVVAVSDFDLKFKSVIAPNGETLGEKSKFDSNLSENFMRALGIIQI